MGNRQKIIGIEITKSDNSILISQEKYIENILKREGMEDANPVSMPMDPNDKIKPNPDGNDDTQGTPLGPTNRKNRIIQPCDRDLRLATNTDLSQRLPT